MTKLHKEPLFYLLTMPISFLAGYGYATSLWLINQHAIHIKQHPETCI